MNYKCILCNNEELIFEIKPRDNNKKDIYKCNNCNLLQLHPRTEIKRKILKEGCLDNQDKNRIYSKEDIENNNNIKYDFNTNINQDDIIINNRMVHVIEGDRYRFLNHFDKIINKYNLKNKKLNILDIGCGYGYWCHTLNEKYNYNVLGMDLNINKVLYGKKKLKLNFDYIIEKIEDENFINNNIEKYDIITCWHVIEHVFDPILFISNIMKLLKKNGKFIFELPNEDDELINLVPEYSKLIHFEDHVNYFNIQTLNLLFSKCNIKNDNYVIKGCQRYGFYNYIDWIRYKTKEKVISDDYININININLKPRSKIEKIWLKYRCDTLNCDTLFGYINKI